jgi:signal transduction histidine kinase
MSSVRHNGGRLRRLSVRLTLWHSLIVLGSGLALLALTHVLLSKRALTNERDAIDFRIAQYSNEYLHNGLEGVRRLAAIRKGRPLKAFFVRFADAENRQTFLRDPEDWIEFEPEQLDRRRPPAEGNREWISLHSPFGTELVLAATRLKDGTILHVGKTNEEAQALLADFRTTGWWLILIFVPASFAGGAFLASRALRPVEDLTGVARSIIVTSRFDARVPERGSGDELAALARVFNEMLTRIEQLVRGMRESIDNVAHDLRTPLMRLSQKAQVLIAANQRASSASRCPNCEAAIEALGDCVEEADRVTTMLNTLMDIAETEAGIIKLRPRPCQLADLVASAVDAYSEYAEDRGVQVKQDVPSDIWIDADTTAFSRVIANLLDNSIKYTGAGGSVTIFARQKHGAVDLRVEDTGIGIPSEDLPRIWERLFRADRSRSERGLGLGLSFVRAIVEAHDGEARAESEPGSGTIVTVRLPAAKPQRELAFAESESRL